MSSELNRRDLFKVAGNVIAGAIVGAGLSKISSASAAESITINTPEKWEKERQKCLYQKWLFDDVKIEGIKFDIGRGRMLFQDDEMSVNPSVLYHLDEYKNDECIEGAFTPKITINLKADYKCPVGVFEGKVDAERASEAIYNLFVGAIGLRIGKDNMGKYSFLDGADHKLFANVSRVSCSEGSIPRLIIDFSSDEQCSTYPTYESPERTPTPSRFPTNVPTNPDRDDPTPGVLDTPDRKTSTPIP